MNKIVVLLEGGLVSSVMATDPNTEIMILDLDSEGADLDEIITQEEVDMFLEGTITEFIDWQSGVLDISNLE